MLRVLILGQSEKVKGGINRIYDSYGQQACMVHDYMRTLDTSIYAYSHVLQLLLLFSFLFIYSRKKGKTPAIPCFSVCIFFSQFPLTDLYSAIHVVLRKVVTS